MGNGVNMFANKQNGSNPALREGWDNIKWGPGLVERDEFGIPLSFREDSNKRKGGQACLHTQTAEK